MSVLQFPDTFYMVPLESSGADPCYLGGFAGPEGELKHIVFYMTVVGTSTGTESFTLNLYSSIDLDTVVATSTRPITDFAVSSNGYNYVRFDFPDINLNPLVSYYIGMTSTGYTRVGDNFYVGPLLEWAEPFYNSGGPKMIILTEK